MYVWEVQGYYDQWHKWEMITIEETKADAIKIMKQYDKNESETPHRIKRTRKKKD